MKSRLWLLPAAATLAASLACVFLGRPVGDEGMYLYSSGLLAAGNVPYRDFLFWQPPPVLFLYAAARGLFGPSLCAMRVVSAGLSVGAILLLSDIARRRGAKSWPWLLAAFLGANLGFTYAGATVRPQALALFLAAAGLWALEAGPAARRWQASSVLLALSVGSRLSFWPLLPGLWLYAYSREGARAARLCAALCLGTLALGAGACLAAYGEPLVFGLWTYHLLQPTPWTAESARQYAAALLPGYAPLLLTAAAGAALFRRARRSPAPDAFERYIGASGLAVFAFQLLMPVRYPAHQLANLPFLALAASLRLDRGLAALPAARRRAFCAGALILALAAVAATDHRLEWGPGPGGLARLRSAAELLKKDVPAGGLIYTTETALAVEGGFRLLPGLNLGVFSHLGRAGLGTAECRRRGGVDNALLRDYFAAGVPDAVLIEPWDLALMRADSSGVGLDAVAAAVRARYRKAWLVPRLGQFEQPLEAWVRKPS